MANFKKLFLLDGFALIYRAYFAFIKNPRINSKGLDTSAIYGFTNTLNDVIKNQKPTHIGVVFDRSVPTERHKKYPDYKANRQSMPEGIKHALPYIDKLLDAYNIPKIYKDGYEADDIIGTLAKKAEKKGYKTYMMTSDKDFAQLVSENIFMFRPGNKWQNASIWGISEVLEKFKIDRVDQVIDFLAMMGDSADNIPGIAGVGEKTAQKFLKEFGSIEGLFENSHSLSGKMKDTINSSKEIGLLCKDLVTIITNVEINLNEKDLIYEQPDLNKLEALFVELEFRTLINRFAKISKNSFVDGVETGNQNATKNTLNTQIDLFSQKEPPNKILSKKSFTLVDKKSDLKLQLDKILSKKKIGFSIVSCNRVRKKILGVAVTCSSDNFYYRINSNTIPFLKTIFEHKDIIKVGYDIKSSIKILKSLEIEINGDLFDVEIANHLINPDTRSSLNIISEHYLNISIQEQSDIVGKGKNILSFFDIDEKIVSIYACNNAEVILKLQELLNADLLNNNLLELFNQVEMPLIKVLASMELEGIAINTDRLLEFSSELNKKLIFLEREIIKHADIQFNVTSPKQLGEVLFEKMNLSEKPKKTKSGQYATSEEELTKYKDTHPIINDILSFRTIKKILSTYVEALPELINPETGRIHTTFNQSVTSTGRLSSTKPNIQNIPIRTDLGMKVREAFVPKNSDYLILAADYSQIELRIMASLSKDPAMISAFKKNEDIHVATASKVYKLPKDKIDKTMRSSAKAVNFGIIYGISAFGLSQNIGVSRKDAKKIIENYFNEFPNIKQYMNLSIENAKKTKYTQTLLGRKRFLRDIDSKNGMIRAMAERNAINTPIQGTAADIIKVAMINIEKQLIKNDMKSKMTMQVHDELVFDMYKKEERLLRNIIKQEMEGAINLNVPLVVDIGVGESWLSAH